MTQEWCRAHSAECLAVQPPGRNMRNKEKPLTSAVDLANMLLPVVATRLLSTPYVVCFCLEDISIVGYVKYNVNTHCF